MPKLSELTPVAALNGTEALPAIIDVGGGAYANVLVPLSVVMSLLDGASFDNISGDPTDNAGLAAALAAKAALSGPTFTGVPKAPTAAPGTNTTQIATTAFVQALVDSLVNSAPGALDTLAELAAALGDDENFAANVTAALAGKADAAATTAALALKASLTAAETLENKRIKKRVVLAGKTTGSLTPNADTTDIYKATGISGITLYPPSGTPTDEQQLIIYIRDNGIPAIIAWVTSSPGFRGTKYTALPGTTTAGKWMRICCIWNEADGYWDVVSVIDQE